MDNTEQNKDRKGKKKKDRALLLESPQDMNCAEIFCVWQYQAKLPFRQRLFLARAARRAVHGEKLLALTCLGDRSCGSVPPAESRPT